MQPLKASSIVLKVDEYRFEKQLSKGYATTSRDIAAARNWKQFRPSS